MTSPEDESVSGENPAPDQPDDAASAEQAAKAPAKPKTPRKRTPRPTAASKAGAPPDADPDADTDAAADPVPATTSSDESVPAEGSSDAGTPDAAISKDVQPDVPTESDPSVDVTPEEVAEDLARDEGTTGGPIEQAALAAMAESPASFSSLGDSTVPSANGSSVKSAFAPRPTAPSPTAAPWDAAAKRLAPAVGIAALAALIIWRKRR